jgi:hypothetical protein
VVDPDSLKAALPPWIDIEIDALDEWEERGVVNCRVLTATCSVEPHPEAGEVTHVMVELGGKTLSGARVEGRLHLEVWRRPVIDVPDPMRVNRFVSGILQAARLGDVVHSHPIRIRHVSLSTASLRVTSVSGSRPSYDDALHLRTSRGGSLQVLRIARYGQALWHLRDSAHRPVDTTPRSNDR